MVYDFETLCPARGADVQVWKMLEKMGITDENAIDYGVAEMKFRVAPEIEQAMRDCIDTGFFGYGMAGESYGRRVCRWFDSRHGWRPEPGQVVQTYGVVSAIAMSIRAYTKPGEGVIIQSPVYNPFAAEIRKNGRMVVENQLVRGETRYTMDFDDLERKAADPNNTMLVLCSPHNPVGRVWTREELCHLSEICLANNVLVVSDEIHCDLVFGALHTPYPLISERAAENCVVCTAASKTFNIPGLVSSNIIIPNEELRQQFADEFEHSVGHFLNVMGVAATTAAYEKGAPWMGELNTYLRENAAHFETLIAERLPRAWTPRMEGTYLAWLDLGFLGLKDGGELKDFLTRVAQISANEGAMYGSGGEGFVRLNIGCPRRYIDLAVDRLAAAIERRG